MLSHTLNSIRVTAIQVCLAITFLMPAICFLLASLSTRFAFLFTAVAIHGIAFSNNYVCVSWGGIVSNYVVAINGVKEDGVVSPDLFCLCIDGLLVALSQAGVGCFNGSYFVGALAYADDIALLAPSAFALLKMLAICDSYANDYHIVFNATKSKCLVVFPSTRRSLYDSQKYCTFYIGDKPIEFVDSFSHLGHLITNKLTDSFDVLKRRTDFIGQVNNMLCYFRKLTLCVEIRLYESVTV
jgi:hypothetical protein